MTGASSRTALQELLAGAKYEITVDVSKPDSFDRIELGTVELRAPVTKIRLVVPDSAR